MGIVEDGQYEKNVLFSLRFDLGQCFILLVGRQLAGAPAKLKLVKKEITRRHDA